MIHTRTLFGLGPLCSVTTSLFLGLAAAQAQDPMGDADKFFQAGKFEKARTAYQKVIQEDASHTRAFKRLGEIALLYNDPTAAKNLLNKAGDPASQDKEIKKLLAEALYRLHEFGAAASLWRKVGQSATADKLASFDGKTPYKISGPPATKIKFVRTDPLPLISIRINNSEPVFFIIDTGGGELILDTEFAKQNGAVLFGEESRKFGGDKKGSFAHGRVDSVQLGDITIEHVPVHVMSTRRFAAAASGKRVDGILGTIVLYHFLSTLDYPNGELVLQRKGTKPPPTKNDGVPFWLAGDHLILAWGCANQAPPSLMLIDTGLAGGGFTCPQSTMKAADFQVGDKSFEGIGGGGTMTVTPFFAERLTLGDLEKKDVMSFFGPFPESLEHRYGFPIGGLLSHSFFRDHAVTFDFSSMQIYFRD